ncbi:NUDIX hydrolase [Microbacterium nymphoidis]|uniref:NUDIX hydrolase n=1 Tax=Microbacterium nymphoidis TaxID=2898586 RepID=UPI001E369628|nr:CoA pyrophosphatase [Microbacterium nymphoidis]MCD2499149.1 CoA pyrophosphatase [Microbacterium nymphoidis]
MSNTTPGGLLHLAAAAGAHLESRRTGRFRPKPTARPAAVLILFGPARDEDTRGLEELTADDLDVVLEVRSGALRAHAGEVAFPGGGAEPEDADIVATALREANEEIGVDAADVDILAQLPEVGTVSDFRVTPVIGWRKAPQHYVSVDEGETADVLRVSVAWLLDPANRFTSVYRHPLGAFHGPAWDLNGVVLWGFTAFLLNDLFDAAGWSIPWDESRTRDL